MTQAMVLTYNEAMGDAARPRTSTTMRTEYMRFLRAARARCKKNKEWADMFNSGVSKQELFGKFLDAGEDLDVVQMTVTRESTNRQRRSIKMGYRTRYQLMELHGGNTAIVDELIRHKCARNESRRVPKCENRFDGSQLHCRLDTLLVCLQQAGPHPDCPTNPAMTQYWVSLETTCEMEHEDLDAMAITANANLSHAAATALTGAGGLFAPHAAPDFGSMPIPQTTVAAASTAGPATKAKAKAAPRKRPPGQQPDDDAATAAAVETPKTAEQQRDEWVDKLVKDVGDARKIVMRLRQLSCATESAPPGLFDDRMCNFWERAMPVQKNAYRMQVHPEDRGLCNRDGAALQYALCSKVCSWWLGDLHPCSAARHCQPG